MPIRKIDKDIGTVPVWGDENFDENVHENFVSLKEIVPQVNNSIDDINEAIIVIDNASQTVNQKAQEVSQNAQTVNQKAQEVSQNAQTVNQKAQEVINNAQNIVNSASKAYQWANNNYNIEVESGYFSSKHWATVAQNVVANKVDKTLTINNKALSTNIILTKSDLSLGNVDNTSDASKPVSTAQLAALNLKVNITDIVDNLTSSYGTKPLSANQGRVLKGLIDNINTLLTSDDTTLDQMQEVVNFIKQNKTDLQNLDLSNIAETTTLKHFTAILKTKLDAIAENANNYSHPENHSASMITESTTRRFVSDTEKTSWNAKQEPLVSGNNVKTINNETILGTGNISVSGAPAGTIILFASPTVPAGYLKANGALVSRTAYSALFAAIGTTFGVGDGSTTFALPDLRGYFPRGWDDGRGIDTSRVFGSNQDDEFKSHTHNNNGIIYVQGSGIAPSSNAFYRAGSTTSTVTGGEETRPKNIALLYCIKY